MRQLVRRMFVASGRHRVRKPRERRHYFTDPASDAHLVWAAMHGLVTIELMHQRWGGPLVAHLQGDPEQNYGWAVGTLLDAARRQHSMIG